MSVVTYPKEPKNPLPIHVKFFSVIDALEDLNYRYGYGTVEGIRFLAESGDDEDGQVWYIYGIVIVKKQYWFGEYKFRLKFNSTKCTLYAFGHQKKVA